MAESETSVAVGEREDTDKSPQAVEEAVGGEDARAAPAEVSNLDIVRHYFDIAADHLTSPTTCASSSGPRTARSPSRSR